MLVPAAARAGGSTARRRRCASSPATPRGSAWSAAGRAMIASQQPEQRVATAARSEVSHRRAEAGVGLAATARPRPSRRCGSVAARPRTRCCRGCRLTTPPARAGPSRGSSTDPRRAARRPSARRRRGSASARRTSSRSSTRRNTFSWRSRDARCAAVGRSIGQRRAAASMFAATSIACCAQLLSRSSCRARTLPSTSVPKPARSSVATTRPTIRREAPRHRAAVEGRV